MLFEFQGLGGKQVVEMTPELHSNLLVLQKKSYQGNVLDFFFKIYVSLKHLGMTFFSPKLQEFSFKSSREEQKKVKSKKLQI